MDTDNVDLQNISDAAPIPAEDIQIELMRVGMCGETYLLPVRDVAEIIRPVDLTPVAMAPDHILGLANVHGQIVCIVDPGMVLHLKGKRHETGEDTRYLILRHPRMHLGIVVDAVTELYRISENSMPPVDEESKNHFRGDVEIDGESYKILNSQFLFE